MSLNSFFDSLDDKAQFDAWRNSIKHRLIHLKNLTPTENKNEISYIEETIGFLDSTNILSSDFLAHHPNMNNKETLIERLKICNDFYKKFGSR